MRHSCRLRLCFLISPIVNLRTLFQSEFTRAPVQKVIDIAISSFLILKLYLICLEDDKRRNHPLNICSKLFPASHCVFRSVFVGYVSELQIRSSTYTYKKDRPFNRDQILAFTARYRTIFHNQRKYLAIKAILRPAGPKNCLWKT